MVKFATISGIRVDPSIFVYAFNSLLSSLPRFLSFENYRNSKEASQKNIIIYI